MKPFYKKTKFVSIVIMETLCYDYCNMSIRIGLQIEKSREHGRSLLAGIADFALENPDWRFDLLAPEDILDTKALSRYDGFIVRVMDDAAADSLCKSGKPVIDTYGRADRNPFDTIRLDDVAISQMAEDYFAEHRFDKCAYCGFTGPRFSAARGSAFVSAAKRSGHPCFAYEGGKSAWLDDTYFRNERTDRIPDAKELEKWIISLPKPIAVFCCNDIRAYQLIRICESAKVQVPDEVAVLGVDNDVLLGTFTHPPLSSIDTDPFELGRKAAGMLAQRMAKRNSAPRVVLHPPRRIAERASTETYPFKTPWLSEAMVYITRNASKGIAAKDVFSHLGYSHTAVNNAFRSELGTSVHKEILRQRLAMACRLLKDTDRPASRIAIESGFLNAQYFSRAFSGAFGKTPDVWRKGVNRR